MADNESKVTVRGRFIGGALWEAKTDPQNPEKKPKFSACVVLDEGEAEKVNAIVERAVAEKWGKKIPAGMQDWGVRRGDDPEYEASYEKDFINPKSTRKPQALAKRAGMVGPVARDEDMIYPGCRVAVSVSAYAYDGDRKANIKAGVTLNCRAVMYLGKGERLDGSFDMSNADSEFADMEAEDIDVADEDDFLS